MKPTIRPSVKSTSESVEGDSDCVDEREHCGDYMEAGYCDRRPDYMSVYCQKSCNLCHVKQTTTSTRGTTTERLTSSTGKTTSPCTDKREYCEVWAAAGMCQSRPNVMNSFCPESCNTCVTQKTSTTSKPRAAVRTQPVTTASYNGNVNTQSATTAGPRTGIRHETGCEDKSDLCSVWESAGYCDSRRDYMSKTCSKTCHLCTGDQSSAECTDRNRFCEGWAKANRCRVYIGYMRTNCAKSCNLCQTVSQLSRATNQDCKDLNSHCGRWASKGYCSIRKDYMGRMCRNSCDLCNNRATTQT